MEKDFNEQESLELINQMIVQARNNFQKGAGNFLIITGYFVAALSIVNIILLFMLPNPSQSFWIWILTLLIPLINNVIGNKRDKVVLVRTHIDTLISKIWFGYMISVAIYLFVLLITALYILDSHIPTLFITSGILCMLGLAQFATGAACRFRPYTYGAIVFWLGALLSVLSYLCNVNLLQFVILAVCMILGFVIPGHIANKKANQNV